MHVEALVTLSGQLFGAGSFVFPPHCKNESIPLTSYQLSCSRYEYNLLHLLEETAAVLAWQLRHNSTIFPVLVLHYVLQIDPNVIRAILDLFNPNLSYSMNTYLQLRAVVERIGRRPSFQC